MYHVKIIPTSSYYNSLLLSPCSGNIGVSGGQPSNVTVEGKQYWAKGTGFGTGSVNSKWNMKETVSKQQQEEALVTTLFEVDCVSYWCCIY